MKMDALFATKRVFLIEILGSTVVVVMTMGSDTNMRIISPKNTEKNEQKTHLENL
jgi:uncharacterized DUF497 family protein